MYLHPVDSARVNDYHQLTKRGIAWVQDCLNSLLNNNHLIINGYNNIAYKRIQDSFRDGFSSGILSLGGEPNYVQF